MQIASRRKGGKEHSSKQMKPNKKGEGEDNNQMDKVGHPLPGLPWERKGRAVLGCHSTHDKT